MRYGMRLALSTMLMATALGPVPGDAQTFNSGSTGLDGAFNPSCTPTPCTLTQPLPVSGTFNFTTITVPAGVTVKFTRNAANTPVTLLASGNVTIAGTIDVSGSPGGTGAAGISVIPNPGAGGPGGFDGGDGSNALIIQNGGSGLGPGGGSSSIGGGSGGGFGTAGAASLVPGGVAYGSPTLLPLIGGSGGAAALRISGARVPGAAAAGALC